MSGRYVLATEKHLNSQHKGVDKTNYYRS